MSAPKDLLAPFGPNVVVEELRLEDFADLGAFEAARRDAQLMSQLAHPAIVRQLGVLEEAGRVYLARERVEGVTLAEVLTTRRFYLVEVLNIAAQILGAIVYLQQLSPAVIHRAIDPRHIVLLPGGRALLAGFESARDRGLTRAGTMIGRAGYAPPEQLRGVVDLTTDVYALGKTLIELLTGATPDADAKRSRELRRLDADVRGWLERMTAARPGARFANAYEALAAIPPAYPIAPVPSTTPTQLAVGVGISFVAGIAVMVALRANDPERVYVRPLPTAGPIGVVPGAPQPSSEPERYVPPPTRPPMPEAARDPLIDEALSLKARMVAMGRVDDGRRLGDLAIRLMAGGEITPEDRTYLHQVRRELDAQR